METVAEDLTFYIDDPDSLPGRYLVSLLEGRLASSPEDANVLVVCDLHSDGVEFVAMTERPSCIGAAYCFEPGLKYELTERKLDKLFSTVGKSCRQIILLSTTDVYGLQEGNLIGESTPLHPTTGYGKLAAHLEGIARQVSDRLGITLTILRVVPLAFGDDAAGEAELMFRRVIAGRFVNVRGTEPQRSIVCALDIARAAIALIGKDGVYNVCDSVNPTLSDIADAMSANAGRYKRIITLPDKWAPLIARLGDKIPMLGTIINTPQLQDRRRSLTFSNHRLIEASGFTPYDTLTVLARTNTEYPYNHKQ